MQDEFRQIILKVVSHVLGRASGGRRLPVARVSHLCHGFYLGHCLSPTADVLWVLQIDPTQLCLRCCFLLGVSQGYIACKVVVTVTFAVYLKAVTKRSTFTVTKQNNTLLYLPFGKRINSQLSSMQERKKLNRPSTYKCKRGQKRLTC